MGRRAIAQIIPSLQREGGPLDNRAMHLLISHASASSDSCHAVLQDLAADLPHLRRCLGSMSLAAHEDTGAFSRSTPSERVMARALGLPDADGCIPWAAWKRAVEGLPTSNEQGQALAWAEVTPCHWHVGLDHLLMENPRTLALGEAESRALLAAVTPLFETEGITLDYAGPTRWWACGDVFEGLQTASLARVIGRNVDAWMPEGQHQPASAKLLRRLQNEVQMLLYQHPVNDERMARGEVAVNSVWFSQCGRLPAGCVAAESPFQGDANDSLGNAVLDEDWEAFARAWRALDATLLSQPNIESITLCGETASVRYDPAPQGLWVRAKRRLGGGPAPSDVAALLAGLSALRGK